MKDSVVQPEEAIGKTGFAETCAGFHHVDDGCLLAFGFGGNHRGDSIQIAIPPRPKVKVVHTGTGLEDVGFTGSQPCGFAGKGLDHLPVKVFNYDIQRYFFGLGQFVPHFSFCKHHRTTLGDIDFTGINIGTSGLQVAVQGQRLIEARCHMKVNIAGDASEVGVEIAVVPLVVRTGGPFLIAPGIVNAGSDDIVSCIIDQVGHVKAERHNPVFVEANRLAIYPKLATKANAFKFQKHLLAFSGFRQAEVLTVPDNGIRVFNNTDTKSFIFVEGRR
ncbi:MAG: hypothetical protein BWY72_01592 [Bacteroidetes bacterium ADurb.Bin416]|nr:MAG: hypothetical protein BWY72_01592 [Bacteroidetes bacterium ADurb.Bin416]